MKGENKCMFIGNVGKDPEVRYTQSGKAVANLSIACTSKWADGEHTEWVRLVCWDKLAEIVGQYVHKGDAIKVEGEMRTRQYQAADGSDRYITEIRVNDLNMLTPKGDGSRTSQPQQQPQQQRQESAPMDDGFDDIPF